MFGFAFIVFAIFLVSAVFRLLFQIHHMNVQIRHTVGKLERSLAAIEARLDGLTSEHPSDS